MLVLKIIGGDAIEDELDSEADAAQACVAAAIRSDIRMCELVRTLTKVDGEGAQRVGTLEMTFTVVWFENDPAPSDLT